MARRTLKVTIETTDEDNRDRGKVFMITEASARTAEDWAARAFLLAAGAGVDIPEEVARNGIAGMAALATSDAGAALFRQLSWSDIKPLAEEMLSCVSIQPNPAVPFFRALVDDDIEEISTLLNLRRSIVELHARFLKAGSPST